MKRPVAMHPLPKKLLTSIDQINRVSLEFMNELTNCFGIASYKLYPTPMIAIQFYPVSPVPCC